jgi:hypothetical protein
VAVRNEMPVAGGVFAVAQERVVRSVEYIYIVPSAPAFAAAVGGAGRGGAAGRGRARGAAPAVVTNTDVPPGARWRILLGVGLERSPDGGATWTPVTVEGATSLRAGAAPSERVCWLAGDRGLVFLSLDGASVQRVTFPEPVNLVSVQATSAAEARVTTADGRTFLTQDGGRTWAVVQ